jgi:hypothetical protein
MEAGELASFVIEVVPGIAGRLEGEILPGRHEARVTLSTIDVVMARGIPA